MQAAQSTYSLLLQKLQESRIAENQNVGNASKISEAEVPEDPTSSAMVTYLGATLMASIAALGTIYLLEARDKSIKIVNEAKELTGLTLLGIIPSFSKSKKSIGINKEEAESLITKVVIRDTPRSPISEAYRMLRANLKFLSADKELKVIVVTSSVPKEGKSTVAANLATAMAQIERKVLLIDGYLHRPVQHKIWEVSNNEGLSNVIVGQAEIKTATKKVMDNLDILTSGVVPPSLNVAADAATLGQMADGVLLVVRPGVVDSVNARFALDLLEKSGQNVLGQVVNGVIPNNEPYNYYYFNEEYYPQESFSKGESVKIVES